MRRSESAIGRRGAGSACGDAARRAWRSFRRSGVWSISGLAKCKAAKNPYRTCAKCFAYYKIAPACPHCGFAPPVEERELPTETKAAVELVTTDLLERNFYVASVNLARSRGFKPGMAAFKFKEKFGKWPPWAWSQETKAQFASDTAWQAKLDHRLAEKAHWAAVEAEAEARAASAPCAEPFTADFTEELPEDDIPF